MSIELEANCVGIAEEYDTLIVGFADLDAQGVPRGHLLLMRSLDARADRPGIGGVEVEINDQARMSDGGISVFRLYRDRAIVRFTKRAMQALDIDDNEVAILFQVNKRKFAKLCIALDRVFRDCKCYSKRVS